MSTSKRIDTICVVVTLLALLLTVFFINGKALGITPIADGDAGDGQFTANDRNGNWDTTGATKITLTGDGGSVTGSGAYVLDGDVHIMYAGKYVLSGELTDGSVIIDATSSDKIWLLLDGVSLHCDDSAVIRVEQAGKVFLTLREGRSNSVSSGAAYAAEAVSAGIDGAIYSRDDLTINGSGSLTVTAAYKHAIVCNDDLVVTGGTLDITAAKDGIHANDSVRIADADITIRAGDDGITASNDEETAYIYIESGSISIPACYEGIEAIDITIAGGAIDIRPTDDGINASGRGSNSVIRVTGGDLTIINETGRDADGLDSNGSIYISGGNIFISVNGSGGSCALDCGSESGGVCKISGGTVIAAGGSTLAEGFDSSSEQCFVTYAASTAAAGTPLTLKNAAGKVLLSGTIPCNFSFVVLSTPELQMGETVTLAIGDTQTEITVDNSSSSGGFGMGGMHGGGGMKGGMFGDGAQQDGTFGGGMKGGMFNDGTQPDGTFGGGMRPDGTFGGRGGKTDQPFDGVTQSTPQIPGGTDGSTPFDGFQMPEGGLQSGGDVPPDMGGQADTQLPDREVMGGINRHGGDQATQWGQNQDLAQGGAAGAASAVSPDALILVGISTLFLLAGILIASKVKH